MEHACNKFYKDTIGNLNMLISKKTPDVVLKVRYLICECLKCKKMVEMKCDVQQQLIKFLEVNDNDDGLMEKI